MKAAALLAPLLLSGAPAADRCLALSLLSKPTLSIVAAHDGPLCHATVTARPRPRAQIGIELWLPAPERWSGRYYQMGNGGFAGHIDSDTLRAAAQRGDAAAATDTGHRGGGFDASWAVGRPDLVADYAYRSIKVTADAARQLIGNYYGRSPKRRYFMGCSYGGRQALVAAARWPGDWDGVIAGAPAIRFLDRLAGYTVIHQALSVAGAAMSSRQLLPAIAAARARCRISSRLGCGVAAVVRGCAAGKHALCLTPPQVRALSTIERAGYPLAEADMGEWQHWILHPDPTTGSQVALGDQAAHLIVPGDRPSASKAPSGFFPSPTLRAPFAVGSLVEFERRGGRIISYFGLADPVLPPSFALSDARAIGARSVAYRLFLMPGMAHCQGGPSDTRFGQSLAAPALHRDPDHDVRSALEAWVERQHLLMTLEVGMRRPDRLLIRPVSLEQ